MKTGKRMMDEWPPERVNPMLDALNQRTGPGFDWSVDFAFTGIRYRGFPVGPFHLCVYPEDGRWFLDKHGSTVARGGPWDATTQEPLPYEDAVDELLSAYQRRAKKK